MSLMNSTGKTFAALAGAAMLASALDAPASAMPLGALAGAAEVGAPVQHVWYDRWGYWHPNQRRWGPVGLFVAPPVFLAPSPAYYAPPLHRQCWYGRWGRLHCAWVR